MKKITTCVDCNINPSVERSRCKDCLPAYNRKRVKQYYDKDKKKRYGTVICDVCKKPLIKGRPNQTTHGTCKLIYKSIYNYNQVPRSKNGNTIGRQMLLDMGYILNSKLIVHHIDLCPDNNTKDNFLIMGRSTHLSLHRFINERWFQIKKSGQEYSLWKPDLIKQITQEWIEKKGLTLIILKKVTPINIEYIYGFL
jgi:hypothetical protein